MDDQSNEGLHGRFAEELGAKFSKMPSFEEHVLVRLKNDLSDPGFYFVPAGTPGLAKLQPRSMFSADGKLVDGFIVTFVHEDGETTSTQAFSHELDFLFDPSEGLAPGPKP